MEEVHSNLLQLFLSCHQGDAARRASAEPRESGNGGERPGDGGLGGQGPPLYMYTYMYAHTCHGYIYVCMSQIYLFMYDLQAQKSYLLLLLLPRTFSSFDA